MKHTENNKEIVEYYKQGKDIKAVATIFKTTRGTIRKILKLHNLIKVRKPVSINYEYFYDLYISKPTSFVSDFTGRTGLPAKEDFLRFLKDKTAPIRDFNRAILLTDNHYKCYIEVDNALRIYNLRRCWADVASAYNLSNPLAAKNIFKYANIHIIEKSKSNFKNVINVEQDICNEYVVNNLLIEQIARKYNTSTYYVRRILINNNIQLKTKTEAIQQTNNSEEHQLKAIKGSYKSKPYILPSGKIIKVQGYENHFLDYIFAKKFQEVDLADKSPRLEYTDCTGKCRHYYPDFFIAKWNLIVEIKSAYTLSKTAPEKVRAGYTWGGNYIIIVDKDYTEFTNNYLTV